MGDVDIGSHTASRSRHLLSDTLGRHVPQLLRILQLKDAITQQHRSLLQAAIGDKRQRNQQIVEQQRLELAARQQRRQLAGFNTQAATSDSMTDVQPTTAASNDGAPAHPVPSATSASNPAQKSSPPLSLPSPAVMATLTFHTPPAPYPSESQLLAVLPPVVAVHLLHCGFSSFPKSALSVLTEATIDFMRRAGVALRETQDNTMAKRRMKYGVKGSEQMESGMRVTGWLTTRLLRSLGLSDVRGLQRFYERAIVRAGERIRQTEERLTRIDSEVRRQRPDTVRQMSSAERESGRVNDGSNVGSDWLCEPFSPLRTFVRPPAMPETPQPLAEEKEDEQPGHAATHATTSSEVMAVDASSSDVAPASHTGESGTVGVNEQSNEAGMSVDVRVEENNVTAASGVEQVSGQAVSAADEESGSTVPVLVSSSEVT